MGKRSNHFPNYLAGMTNLTNAASQLNCTVIDLLVLIRKGEIQAFLESRFSPHTWTEVDPSVEQVFQKRLNEEKFFSAHHGTFAPKSDFFVTKETISMLSEKTPTKGESFDTALKAQANRLIEDSPDKFFHRKPKRINYSKLAKAVLKNRDPSEDSIVHPEIAHTQDNIRKRLARIFNN